LIGEAEEEHVGAIRVARIFDGERLHRDGGVVVTDRGRIGEVRLGHHPDDLELVDGTLLPGLIDCHVNLC
jgi:imidazolonepropionase-like amidohydrolase